MTRIDGANLLKRRLKKIGMVGEYSPHSFRATGITRFLEEGGTLEAAQYMADTPTAGPPSYTTAAARKYSAKMLSGFATESYDVHRWRIQASIKKSRHQKSSFRTRNLTSGPMDP
jgi:hypothetical protein